MKKNGGVAELLYFVGVPGQLRLNPETGVWDNFPFEKFHKIHSALCACAVSHGEAED